MCNLNQHIAEYLGTNESQYVNHFRQFVRMIHSQMVERAHENNSSMADVFEHYGVSPAKFGAVVRGLREGKDTNEFLHFDQMAEYAVERYRHLMPSCSSDSDSGSSEHLFAQWLIRGYLVPEKIASDTVMRQAAQLVGEAFLEEAAMADVPF